MTVSYSRKVATVSHGTFILLLFNWKGSVYKLIWPGLLIFCFSYLMFTIIYQCVPSTRIEFIVFKRYFVQLCTYAGYISQAIPISFILGFYVNLVLSRWWKMFENLPTVDSVCLLLATFLRDPPQSRYLKVTKDNENRAMLFRRTVSRYINLSAALCFSTISVSMRHRFPTYDSLVSSGLMTDQELVIYAELDEVTNSFYVPLVWAITLITKAYHEKMIQYDRELDILVKAVVIYWDRLFKLFLYNWVNVPLVYNQVVSLSIYVYFAICVFSYQFADPELLLKNANLEAKLIESVMYNFTISNQTTPYSFPYGNGYIEISNTGVYLTTSVLDVFPHIPVFGILTFIFYNGWLKVAELNLIPFGMDDNDFDVVPLLERNLNTSLFYVDTMLTNPDMLPELVRTGCKVKVENDLYMFEHHDKILANNLLSPSTPTRSRHLGDWDLSSGMDDHGAEIGNSPQMENQIPELPNPEYLKRKLTQSALAGSMGLIYADENAQRQELKIDHSDFQMQSRISIPSSTAVEQTGSRPDIQFSNYDDDNVNLNENMKTLTPVNESEDEIDHL